jgi:hypothetical protein
VHQERHRLRHHRLGVRIELRTTAATDGRPIKGTLLVENPGAPLDLTQLAPPPHCRPVFEISLASATIDNQSGFSLVCTTRAFPIAHGTT